MYISFYLACPKHGVVCAGRAQVEQHAVQLGDGALQDRLSVYLSLSLSLYIYIYIYIYIEILMYISISISICIHTYVSTSIYAPPVEIAVNQVIHIAVILQTSCS